jgi:hypothetical protein
MKEILQRSNLQLRSGWRMLLWLLVALGIVTFIASAAMGDPERAWQALLINTVFFGGMAQAGVMLSVIWQLTDAKWGRPFKRLAEGFGAFLPVAFVMFILVAAGSHYLYEWAEHPMPAKAAWLNPTFFTARNVVAMLVMYGLTYAYVMASIKPDLALARHWFPGWGGAFAERVLRGYGDREAEHKRLYALSRRLAPALGIVFAFVASLMAFDFIMSLDQGWFSTLFGVFTFMGWLYSALALMLIVVTRVRKLPLLDEYMTINRVHDLAKLTFAIALVYAYMSFSQILVIWYSNLPEETPFLVSRIMPGTPWYYLFWTLFGVLFVFPFLGLMPRTVCRNPTLVAGAGLILFLGQWWAHYLLTVPSIQASHGEPHFVFGVQELLVSLGFLGAFLLCFFAFMSRVPIMPVSDPQLVKTWHGH